MIEETGAKAARLGASSRLTSPVLVGREREFSALVEAVSPARGVVFVEGEAGVGKTRLVEEVLAARKLTGRRVFVGRCHQLSEALPLAPVLDALRDAAPDTATVSAVVGALRPLLPEIAESLPPAPAPLRDEQAERHRIFRALRELIAAHGRVVLLLEDLHWSDPITLDFLRFLIPQLPPALTIIGTYRRVDVSEVSREAGLAFAAPRDARRTKVTLTPLDEGGVRELVRSILETSSVSEEFTRHLFEWTAGIPFAVEEVLLLLRQRRDLVRQRGVWVRHELKRLEVPGRLRDAMLERLGVLPADARAIVYAAATLAMPAEEPILAAVSALEETRAARGLSDALSAALVFDHGDGRYGLRHPLAGQAVEEGITPPLARKLHLRAACALERARPRPVARIAHHYKAAGEPKKWIRYAEAAADAAVSLDDHATAYAFMSEAMRLDDIQLRTRGRLAIRLLRHAHRCHAYEQGSAAVQHLIDDERLPPSTRGELHLGVGRLLGETGDRTGAKEHLLRAVDALAGRPDLAAAALALLATARTTADSPEEQRRLREATLAAADAAAQSADRATQISAAAERAWVLLTYGDRRGWDALSQIPAPGRSPKEVLRAATGYANAADALLHLGHYERAEELTVHALGLVDRYGHASERAVIELTKLQLDWCRGRWGGLEEKLLDTIERAQKWPRVQAEARAVLGLLLSARGDTRRATEVLTSVSARFDGDLPVSMWLAGGVIRLKLTTGNPGPGATEARGALEVLRRSALWIWGGEVVPVSVEALLADGAQSEAEAAVHALAEGIRGRDAPVAAAAMETARATLAVMSESPARAARAYLNAAQVWDRVPRPYEAARARAVAGRLTVSTDAMSGRRLLLDALEVFHELQAARDEEAVRRDLRDHGLLAPSRRGRKSYGTTLSPRERQVAALAADGMTNREIGDLLFLSVKTVEGHLKSVMRKLDVSRRTEIGERLPSLPMHVSAHHTPGDASSGHSQ